MEKTADAVVIGGGIMGASIGHFLAKRGFGNILLFEKRTLAAVSTGHSAAHVRTYYSNPVTVQLAWRAVQMFENDREDLGGDCGFQQVGFLTIFDEKKSTPGKQVLELQKKYGVEIKNVSTEEVGELAPQINLDGVFGGLYEHRSGYANPVKTTRSLVERASEWGLKTYEGVGVSEICLQDDRVSGVILENGETIDTKVVVNAAGPWGRQVGFTAGRNSSLRWSRESDMILKTPPDFGPLPVLSDTDLRMYLRPNGNDEILAGLGWPKEIEPLDIDDYDPNLDHDSRARIESALFKRIPALRNASFVRGWASIYTITDDWHPIVGPEPGLDGYYAFFGGCGHCFKLSPPIGESLADIIAGDTPKIDISALRPNRFIEGETLTSAWGDGNRG